MTRKQKYFIKQKLMGLILIVGSVLASITLLEGDATITLISIPIGLMMMFSKEMWLVNEYYYEIEEAEESR